MSVRPLLLLATTLTVVGCLLDTRLHDELGRAAPERPTPPLGPDTDGPSLGPLELTEAADCLRLRITSDEPATATAHFRAGALREERPLGGGGTLFDVAVRVPGLLAGAPAEVTVLAVDAAGNWSAPGEPTAFRVPPSASPLAITELLINPAGDESAQEYVEVRNLGAQPATLAGLRIEDDGGGDDLPPVDLGPGATALVVGMSYDPASATDPPPAAGTPLLRVAGRIGRDGLRQKGDVVRLVGPEAVVLSSYGGWVDTGRAGWQGRSVHRAPDPTACDHPRAWSDSPAPPTPGW
jgi:hypothetical protein